MRRTNAINRASWRGNFKAQHFVLRLKDTETLGWSSLAHKTTVKKSLQGRRKTRPVGASRHQGFSQQLVDTGAHQTLACSPKWLQGPRLKVYPGLSQWEYSSFTHQRFTCAFLKEYALGPGAVTKTRDLVLTTSDWKELWCIPAVDLTMSTEKSYNPQIFGLVTDGPIQRHR